eukprot:68172_1
MSESDFDGDFCTPAEPVDESVTTDVVAKLKELGFSTDLGKASKHGIRSGKSKKVKKSQKVEKSESKDLTESARKSKKKSKSDQQKRTSVQPEVRSKTKKVQHAESTRKLKEKMARNSAVQRKLQNFEPSEALSTNDSSVPWYEAPVRSKSRVEVPNSQSKIEEFAENIHNKVCEKFDQNKQHSEDVKLFRDVQKSGTTNDKIYSMTLMVQQAPMFRLRVLNMLLAAARKSIRRESKLAAESLQDLFVNTLLPDRKLISFSDRTFGLRHGEDELLRWFFEGTLKRCYADFIGILENGTHDELTWYKSFCLGCLGALLTAKSECEQTILTIIMNKLTDTDRKVVSKASHVVRQVLEEHPSMKINVVREVTQLLNRPNVSTRAQYFGVVLLNQIILSRESDGLVAKKLVEVYFDMFRVCANVRGEGRNDSREVGSVHSKLLGALLTGVNRAAPFAGLDDEVFDQHTDSLFRMVHASNFNIAVQALLLTFQVMSARNAVSDRFYRALYETLLHPDLPSSNKLALYFNILWRALKQDVKTTRVSAFAKRLLQVCMHQKPTFVCSALVILSAVMQDQRAVGMLMSHPEYSEDQDGDEGFLVEESKAKETGESDEMEVSEKESTQYDIHKRDPQHAKADNSCLWELVHILEYFHPSVQNFARTLAQSKLIVYSGDPLMDFSNRAFLDKFAYRNPKKNSGDKSFSNQRFKRSSAASSQAQPLNTKQFLEKDAGTIKEDEVFFYKYFKKKEEKDGKTKKKPKLSKEEKDAEEEAFAEALFEKEMEKVNGPADIDDDDDMDFDYSSDESISAEVQDDATLQKMFGDEDSDFASMSDEDGDEGADSDDLEENSKSSKKKESDSPFAAAEEFADILEKAGVANDEENSAWQDGKEAQDHSGDDEEEEISPKQNKSKRKRGRKPPRGRSNKRRRKK